MCCATRYSQDIVIQPGQRRVVISRDSRHKNEQASLDHAFSGVSENDEVIVLGEAVDKGHWEVLLLKFDQTKRQCRWPWLHSDLDEHENAHP